MATKKKVYVIGGGTFSYVRAHLALAAPAFGETAKQIAMLCRDRFTNMDTELVLTKMADPNSSIVTTDDLNDKITEIINNNETKVVFFNAAVCDFDGSIDNVSGKYADRLQTKNGQQQIDIVPAEKIVKRIRAKRKDIFLVAFKTTCDASPAEQYKQGLNLLKKASVNLVLANDIKTRNNIIITPEEGAYYAKSDPTNRVETLRELVEIAWHRTHLSFTRSTVVAGTPVTWNDAAVYPALRNVVNWCIEQGAYKKFNGVTTGHFAAKLSDNEFLTSIRKTNFNDIDKNGMVYVKTDGEDNVISIGAKPSVGGQSQRIIFNTFKDTDCIVHFHCPLKENPKHSIPVVSQREYECGSHECGQNTADGLQYFDGIYAVMLDKHGPNIVFHHSINPNKVKQFIADNFDLTKSTSGFEQVYLDIA